MKTKVSSENSAEGVPSQTTAVTTIANTAQSSVWSICDISTDSHVELRDITPSISPVFTDDQVHELTRNPPEVDVLSEHFLPPDTFKRIDEVLSSGGQTNLLYSDPVLSHSLKQNHDMLLPGELGFHGPMFPSFDSIVEADRILNKRDESSEENDSEANPSNKWNKDGVSVASVSVADATENSENQDQDDKDQDDKKSGADKGLRRSPRKRIQVKKDSDTPKTGNPASKSISRGKDISKLKYANTKPEAEKKETRRSGRAQKKVEMEENNADYKATDTVVNTEKKINKDEEDGGKDSSGQEDSPSNNIRRSPRNQRKAAMEGKQKTPRQRRGNDTEDSDENKKKSSSMCDKKESVDKTVDDTEDKSAETKPEVDKETIITDVEETERNQEEKSEVRKSGRLTRNKEKKPKEEAKVKHVKKETEAKEVKEKAEETGLKIGDVKMEGKSESDTITKELSKKDDNKDISKRSSSLHKPDKTELSFKQEKGGDSGEKASRRRKTEKKVASSEDDDVENTKRVSSRKEERKTKELIKENAGEGTEILTKPAALTKANDGKQKTEKAAIKTSNSPTDDGSENASKGNEKSKRVVKIENTDKTGTDKNSADDSDKEKKPREKDAKPSQEEEGDSDAESLGHDEEFNDDSDYDPEYDPDRLWCVCRKPHGNRFMICCDHCEEWFHGMCVGITMAQGRQMEKNGQEYVCPKCKAKVEEESTKKVQQTSEMNEKENGRITTATSEQVERTEEKPSPTPERRQRKVHTLKLKLPGDQEETRKRRHSSHRRSREEMAEDFSSKRCKESEILFFSGPPKDEKKKQVATHKSFRIPKKVRTTPTPASYMNHPTQPKCITAGCSMFADHHSLYCSPECIQRHAEESLKMIAEERNKRMGSKSSVSSSKNVTTPTSSFLGPVPWNSHPPSVSSHAESTLSKEGVAVIERSTGRVFAGVAAPTQEEIVEWLQDHPTFEVLRPSVGKDEKKKEKKEDSEKTVRDNIRKSLKEILTTRSKEQQDLSISEGEIDKCSHNVEGEMFSFFGDTGHRYKNKYRSLMFNLKDPRNKVLFRHVLSGEISVDRLVRMTPEQLASPELATWREQEAKHTLEMIRMNQEEINATKAHIKKTHKGEVEIDDDDLSTFENSVKANAELKVEKGLPDSNTSSSTLLLDTTDEHRIHLFDLNCRICTGKMAPPGEPPRRETPAPLVSTTSIVQAVAESSIPSPTPMDIVTSASSPDSATVTQPPVSPSVLSKTPKKVPAVWKGFVMMQSVAKFGTSAYRVSGSCDDLLQLLPDTLHVQGRIAHEQVWDYLLQLKSSTSREVCVIRYEASSDDEKLSYVSLYSYFYSRKRCGVVSNCYTGVKDMYLVPLASHQHIPPELLPFDGPGLDEPRPHMLLGIIVRSKVLFKRPRALSQRSLSPPPKRRTSSASVETSSSEGGTGESPASKQGMLSELHDSPPADIDDIVFQYNTSQARKKTIESPAKASPTSETSTPSMASSSGVVVSSPVPADKSSVPSLEAQKQQLLDLQERARQYILAQTQRKETTSVNDETRQEAEEKSQNPDARKVEFKGGEGKVTDDDAPYDPEEGLQLDLDSSDPTPAKPAVPVTSQELPKPSSLQMLVSTLQRLQSAAVKSVSPHLASLSTVLPMGSSAASGDTTVAATADPVNKPLVSGGFGIQSMASASSILQPIVPGSQDVHPVSSSGSAPQLSVKSSQQPMPVGLTGQPLQCSVTADRQILPDDRHAPQPAGATDKQPVLTSLTKHMPQRDADRQLVSDSLIGPTPRHEASSSGAQVSASSELSFQSRTPSDQRHQPIPEDSRHANRWNLSEPPQVTRQVNNVTQQIGQYSGLRPEERARLAAHESRLGSRESRRVSGERRDEHCEQRLDESHRGTWYNETRYPRDSRPGDSGEVRYPRDSRPGDSNEVRYPRDSRPGDSRGDWRHQHRPGRQWHDEEQRRERHGYPLNERPRYDERREERRFKEHWSRDRWRR